MSVPIDQLLSRLSLAGDQPQRATPSHLSRSLEIVFGVQVDDRSGVSAFDQEVEADSYAEVVVDLLGVVDHDYHDLVRVVSKHAYRPMAVRPQYQAVIQFTKTRDFNNNNGKAYFALNSGFSHHLQLGNIMGGTIVLPVFVDISGIQDPLPESIASADNYLLVDPADYRDEKPKVARLILDHLAEKIHQYHYEGLYRLVTQADSARGGTYSSLLKRGVPSIIVTDTKPVVYPEWQQQLNRVDFQASIQPSPVPYYTDEELERLVFVLSELQKQVVVR